MTFTLGGGSFGFRIGLALIVAAVSLSITPAQAASRTPASAARKAPEPSRKPFAQAPARAAAAAPGKARASARAARDVPGLRSSRRTAGLSARETPGANRGGAGMMKVSLAPRNIEPPRISIGQAIGLHHVDDPLDLKSSVALVIDQQTGQPLFQKNAEAVLPIASITKVMTAMVVLDAGLRADEILEVTEADRDTERNSGSRLPIGSRLTRAEMVHLALMSSENRAAHALGRNYPGGLAAFVAAMNAKARAIGMGDSQFADPTGLSSSNVSNARDLARMVRTAHAYPLIRQFSTATDLTVDLGPRQAIFRSTNRLVDAPGWDIGLQKTGYISEAGKCLVMQTKVDSRQVIIVLLDAVGAQSRFADAQRLKRWLSEHPAGSSTEPNAARGDSRS
jgi:D-alanyl-D-alanine endopeptidase (penicillin-binding protein 7)